MKKFALNLDELNIDSFATEGPDRPAKGTVEAYVTTFDECGGDTNDAQCQAATYGGRTCDTTCFQIICGCSQFDTDCDYTCPGYWNAEQATCTQRGIDCGV